MINHTARDCFHPWDPFIGGIHRIPSRISHFRGYYPSMFDLLSLNASDLEAVWLTLELAFCVTVILLLIGIPMAWWLAHSSARSTHLIAALVTVPLFLPPTVLGFYMLIAMGPNGWIGALTQRLHLDYLPFTFKGLVLTSVIYSMPFVIQPICDRFKTIGLRAIETAATLRASPLEAFFSVVLPMARTSILSAAVLGFAHTVGEFGVVLMIGGNIQGVTRVVSVQIYDHVEAMEYAQAHILSGGMVGFAFLILVILNILRRQDDPT